MNLFIAVQLASVTNEGDSCVWYLMNFILEVSLGMFFYLFFLWLINTILLEKYFPVSAQF